MLMIVCVILVPFLASSATFTPDWIISPTFMLVSFLALSLAALETASFPVIFASAVSNFSSSDLIPSSSFASSSLMIWSRALA